MAVVRASYESRGTDQFRHIYLADRTCKYYTDTALRVRPVVTLISTSTHGCRKPGACFRLGNHLMPRPVMNLRVAGLEPVPPISGVQGFMRRFGESVRNTQGIVALACCMEQLQIS